MCQPHDAISRDAQACRHQTGHCQPQGNAAALPAALNEATKGDHTQRIFLRADKTVPYGNLMDAMNALRAANYLKVALVGLEPEATP